MPGVWGGGNHNGDLKLIRRPFSVIAILAVLCGAALTVLWARSVALHWDEVSGRVGVRRFEVISIGGSVYLLAVDHSPHAPRFNHRSYDYAATTCPRAWVNDLEYEPKRLAMGFSVGHGFYAYTYGEHATDYGEYRAAAVPSWFVLFLAALPAVLRVSLRCAGRVGAGFPICCAPTKQIDFRRESRRPRQKHETFLV